MRRGVIPSGIVAVGTLLGAGGTASASCPICFVTAGIGLLLARYFGLSMEVVGSLTGGLSAVAALWMHYAIKRFRFPYRPVVFCCLMVFLNNILMIPGSGVGLGRFLFLLIFSPLAAWAWFGAGVLFVAILLSKAQKRVSGRVLFPFQTVVVSVGAMLVACGVPALVRLVEGL